MSIFTRSSSAAQETKAAASPEVLVPAGLADQPADIPSPYAPARAAAAPGVVPPPAAPMYSMRPPESASRVDGDAAGSASDNVKAVREAQMKAQVSVQEKVRVAAQRNRATSPMQAVRRQTAQQTISSMSRAALTFGGQPFDPIRATQAGLLNLAWRWQEAGAPIRAIHTYVELLERYPDTPAADAAVADLVELSEKLTEEGQFHTALAIYDHLEHLA